jgi:hypothetical protein
MKKREILKFIMLMTCPFRWAMEEAHLREFWVDPAAEATAPLWMFINSNYPFITNWYPALCSWILLISKRHRQQPNACRLRIKNFNLLKLKPCWLVWICNRRLPNTKTCFVPSQLQTVSSRSSSSPCSINWWPRDKNTCRLRLNGNVKKILLPLR